MENHCQQQSIINKLHDETAMIAWKELQRFFAKGVVLVVDDSLDLVLVASYVAQDDAQQLAPLLESNKVAAATDHQAHYWFDNDVELWSVVVAPFVLVQATKPS